MNWIDSTVGEFCPFIYGKGLPQSKRKAGNVPVYGSNGRVDYHDESHVKQHGIVIGRKGSVGAIHLCEEPFWPIDTAFYVEKESIDELRFTYYLLKSLGLEHMNSDSAVPGLNRENAQSLTIKIPEQVQDREALGAWIAKFDQKIILNRQINQTLESMAQAIFKSWFVDFDPVKAKISALESGEDTKGITRAAMRAISGKTDDELDKMEGGQPEDYVKLKTTAELFPAAMQDLEFGEVPEGWEVKIIIDFGSVVCGKTPPKKDDDNYGGDIPFIKIPDMHENVFATNTTEYLSVIGEKTQIKKQIPKSSVCVSCIATVGLVSIAAKACHTNQQINSIVPRDIMLTPYLYFSMLERNKLLHDLASGGSATLNLNTGNFAKIELLSPSFELLKEFYKKVSPIFEMLLSSNYQVQQLTQLRDTLLPKLLSGELSVDTIELVEAEA